MVGAGEGHVGSNQRLTLRNSRRSLTAGMEIFRSVVWNISPVVPKSAVRVWVWEPDGFHPAAMSILSSSPWVGSGGFHGRGAP